MLWLCLPAFNIGNRTENGAYSVLAVFGQPRQRQRQKAKETTTLPRDLCPPPHTHTHTQGVGGCAVGVWGVGLCVQSAAVAVGALLLPHFIVFVVLPSG